MNSVSARTPALAMMPPLPRSPDGRWLAGLPLRDFLELGALPAAPGSARGHVTGVLREWGLGGFRDAVVAVASELVANSVLATCGARRGAGRPPVRMWMLGGSSLVVVLVWDAVAGTPVRREAGRDDESGRGLAIVDALSARWGYFRSPVPFAGKVTWSLVDSP